MSFNFLSAVPVCSDFGVQENKICHCFLFFSPSTLTLCNFNYFSKVLFLSTIILGVKTSIHKLRVGDAFSLQRKEKRKNMNEGIKEVI